LVLLISCVFISNHSFVNRLNYYYFLWWKLVCLSLRSQISSPWIKSSFIVWRLKKKLQVSIWISEELPFFSHLTDLKPFHLESTYSFPFFGFNFNLFGI
jgi:hypothetical protein